MYVVKAVTLDSWLGAWDEFIGVFDTLEDAIPYMEQHSDFHDVKLDDSVWTQGDGGLVYESGSIEYVAIKVELV